LTTKKNTAAAIDANPSTTATARSTTFPRNRNVVNSAGIVM
jgi:hypothetical protein